MAISLEEVDRIAKLSRLKFSDSEKQKFQAELSSILDYVDQLKQLEGKSGSTWDQDADGVNLMRDDVVETELPAQTFLSQAPSRQDNFIKVKSIL